MNHSNQKAPGRPYFLEYFIYTLFFLHLNCFIVQYVTHS